MDGLVFQFVTFSEVIVVCLKRHTKTLKGERVSSSKTKSHQTNPNVLDEFTTGIVSVYGFEKEKFNVFKSKNNNYLGKAKTDTIFVCWLRVKDVPRNLPR